MSSKKITDFNWYTDNGAIQRNEPGIVHSFMSSLASALNHIDGKVDPVWLMGSSAFAFRIMANEIMCPSAMSMFDWTEVLPEVIEQSGHDCYYISRLWHEGDKEEERRRQAHELMVQAIDGGIPAIVWDVAEAEWGLIIGYDDETGLYDAVTNNGKKTNLPYEKLGKNGIDILSVTIPGNSNGRSRDEIIHNSLMTAVQHAWQKEWMDRPKYQDGLPAYDMWATIFERWQMLAEDGMAENIKTDLCSSAEYYSSHYYSARCYARDYLKSLAGGNEFLTKAYRAFERAASCLKPVWEQTPKTITPGRELLQSHEESIRNAGRAEAEGIEHIKEFLVRGDSSKRATISLE